MDSSFRNRRSPNKDSIIDQVSDDSKVDRAKS